MFTAPCKRRRRAKGGMPCPTSDRRLSSSSTAAARSSTARARSASDGRASPLSRAAPCGSERPPQGTRVGHARGQRSFNRKVSQGCVGNLQGIQS